ncbi:hypothetical protein AVEN_51000-1, partial [Araneus ventricosus]
CPVDEDIMGTFEYVHNKTQARVTFQVRPSTLVRSRPKCNVDVPQENRGCDDVRVVA